MHDLRQRHCPINTPTHCRKTSGYRVARRQHGTSVEMLGDFYGKKRMRDPKVATEPTKDRRRERIV